MRLGSASTLLALLLAPITLAQREEAEVEWQKRRAKIEYGVVGVGRHKLDELQVGTDWRMGRNEASVLRTEMALLLGDRVVVPGSYRVKVARQGPEDFALQLDGGSLGEAPQGSPGPVHAKAELKKPDKPSKVLEVTFKADGKSTNGIQQAKVTIVYGENQIVAPVSLVGTKSQKAGGWTVDGFTLPAELVEKRVAEKPIPVAAFKKESGEKKNPFHVWNLVVGKESAELWPAPAAPTDSFGFGEVKGLEGSMMVKATSVKWEESKDSKPFLEVTKVEMAKGKGATIVIAVGRQTCTITVPEPKIPS
jgi:hypothetical protein